MKRFVSLTLAIVMIFAFAVSVAAKPSPTGKQYLKITTAVEYDGMGTADTSASKVQKGIGATVTLSAAELEGYFTCWIISGDYTILDGKTLQDEVITIVPTTDIHAIANFRKDEDYLYITVEAIGKGTASADKDKIPYGSDEVVTLTAVDGEEEFVEWELLCDYKIVSGNLKSRTLKIVPYTDIHAIAYFKGATKPGGNNGSNTSPKTGDPLFAVIPFMAIALAAAFISMKKLKEEN